MAVSYADRQALAVLAPTVTRELQISDVGYGWLLSAFSLAYLVAAPFAGRAIDHFGARRGLVAAVLAWSAVAGMHALLPGPTYGFVALLALRVALGVAEAPSFPGATQTVHRTLLPVDRPRGFGVLYVGSSLGAMVVPPLCGWMQGEFGFRIAFLGVAAVGLLWVPIWMAVTSPAAARAVLDRPTADGLGVTPPWAQLLRDPVVLRGIAATAAVAPLMSFTLNWSAKYLVAAFALPQRAIGHYLWLPPLLFDVGSVAFGVWAATVMRARNQPAPRLPMALAAGLGAVLVAIPLANGPWLAVLLCGVAMAGGGGMFALFTADTLGRVPASAVAATAGCLASAQSIAYIAASPLIGKGVMQLGYAWVLAALVLWLLPGLLFWASFRRAAGPAVVA